MKVLEKDIEIVKTLAKKHVYLNTISCEFLDPFEKQAGIISIGYNKSIRRFRNALNELERTGFCKKTYQGSTAYQTSDTLGGRVYIDYDFTEWIKNNNS